MSDRQARLILAGLLVLFFATGLSILPLPFTRDQGIYSYMAWRWLGGALPYRDAFDHKGPLLYLIYMASLKFSGGAMWGPNLADLIARTLTVGLVYVLGRALLSPRGALFSALFTALPLLGIFNSCWWNAQAETFMMPWLTASAWLCLRQGPGVKKAINPGLAGLVMAQAVMLKPTALLPAAFLIAWLAWAPAAPAPSSRRRFGPTVIFITGLATGLAPWILYFAIKGALPAMWEVLVVFNTFHAVGVPAGASRLMILGRGFWAVFYLLPLLGLPLFLSRKEEARTGTRFFLLAWLVICLLTVAVQAKFFLYHWLAAIPAMGLLAGAGLERLEDAMARRGPLLARAATGLIALFFLVNYAWTWVLVEESYQTREYLEKKITLAAYYSRFSAADAAGKGDFNLLASAAAADFARKLTAPNDRLLVFGYEPIVNYLAARPAPSRFEIDYPLSFHPLSARARAYQERWRREFMADLKKAPPALVILVDNDQNSIEAETSIRQAQAFPEFWSWLMANYQPGEIIEDFHFFRPRLTPLLPKP